MYECTTCGACCHNTRQNIAEGYPWYLEIDEPDSPLLQRRDLARKHVVYDPQEVPHMRLHPEGRCTALRGRIGLHATCDVYKARPRGCRLIQPGDPACLQARRDMGLEADPHATRAARR
jgi:Fe-S-cluster containining protein